MGLTNWGENMSGEIIAILGVGVALAGLILNGQRGLRGLISRGFEARSRRFEPRLLNCVSAWRTSKDCSKGCARPSLGGSRLAKAEKPAKNRT